MNEVAGIGLDDANRLNETSLLIREGSSTECTIGSTVERERWDIERLQQYGRQGR